LRDGFNIDPQGEFGGEARGGGLHLLSIKKQASAGKKKDRTGEVSKSQGGRKGTPLEGQRKRSVRERIQKRGKFLQKKEDKWWGRIKLLAGGVSGGGRKKLKRRVRLPLKRRGQRVLGKSHGKSWLATTAREKSGRTTGGDFAR